MSWVSGIRYTGSETTFSRIQGYKKHWIPDPQHWNSAAWSPFFEAGRGEDVIEGGGEEPAVVLPADQAVAHKAKLHAQAAKFDTRHYMKPRGSNVNTCKILYAALYEFARIQCTHTQNTKRGVIWNHEDPVYTRTKYDTRHQRKPRGSMHCTRRLQNMIRGIKENQENPQAGC